MANVTAGVDDAGVITFGAAYEDFKAADILLISGTDSHESKTVVFTEWMMRSWAKMIFVVRLGQLVRHPVGRLLETERDLLGSSA